MIDPKLIENWDIVFALEEKYDCTSSNCSWTWTTDSICDTHPCGSQTWKYVYGTQTAVSGGITYYTGSSWVVTSDCNADGVDYICTGVGPPAAVGTCGGTLAPYFDWLCQFGETTGVDCQNGYGEITGTGLCFTTPCNCEPKPIGCCKTYTCLAADPSNGNAQLGYYLTSTVPTIENCSTGDSTCCFDDGSPPCLGAEYKIWYPDSAECPSPGSWHETSTCPQGCTCPEEAPTEDGTNGQSVSYQCDSCSPPCGEGDTCCSGTCTNTDNDENNCGDCGIPCLFPLGFCCNGECCTQEGCCTIDGIATCKDIKNDPDYCGNCTTFCGDPESTTPQTCCDGECKDLRTDPNNCKGCGVVCAEGQGCCLENPFGCTDLNTTSNCGECGLQCDTLDPSLNIQCCNGECRPINIDNDNCGLCGRTCATGVGEFCCNGNCCPAENSCCFGSCVNRNTDTNNCGSCGFVCPSGDQCVNGVCLACNPPCLEIGTACCNNSCIDIWSDESNCGGCGIPCAGLCCGGICKNPLNDMYNCGDCGIECPQMINQINLWQCCNGECKNLKTDPENCGICGLTCQEPPGDTFTVPKCFLGNCAEPECDCESEGMPATPGPNDVAFVASCVGNTVSCDGSCYFDAVGGSWVVHEEPGGTGFSGSCGKEPDITYCVDDKYVCVGDIYYCVKTIEGQDMPTYCIPKPSFDPLAQAKIGEYIGTENCTAGCSGDGSECDPNPCPNGKTCCDSQCVDLQTDTAHCGSCDAAPCADGETCKDGVCEGCTPLCASGESCCEGGTTCCEVCCADACCPSGESCVDGVCATCEPPCTAGQTCCGGSCCDAGIICCDQTCCAEGEFCDNGECATCNPLCYPDETCCDGECIRWKCGECPNACASAEIVCCGLPGQEVCCPEGQTCVENACYGCTPPCTESQDCCDEVCREVGTNTDCSGCDDACSETEKCCDKVCTDITTTSDCGDCGIECTEDQDCCDGVPTTLGTDTDCSSCGNACVAGETKCCPSLYGSGSTCRANQEDNNNCGDCGRECDVEAGEDCEAGVCIGCDPPCTGLDKCCNKECCTDCCDDGNGGKECCSDGLLCVTVGFGSASCLSCLPLCNAPGQTCCGNTSSLDEDGGLVSVGSCCSPGVLCCNHSCCSNPTDHCCDNKVCCTEDQVCCDGVCCIAGQFCENGECKNCNPVCYSDEVCCSGDCIRWQCGDCPNACTQFQTCTNGICCSPVTEGPLSGQTGVGCGTICCDPGIACCRDICCTDPDEECCDGFCLNTHSTDNLNCGGCNSPCVAPATCCNGTCRTVFNDSNNCGGCEWACPLGMFCCPDSGGCVSPSYLNCGSCGNECAVGQSCCPDGQGGHTCLAQGSC